MNKYSTNFGIRDFLLQYRSFPPSEVKCSYTEPTGDICLFGPLYIIKNLFCLYLEGLLRL